MLPERNDLLDDLVAALGRDGYAVHPGFWPEAESRALLAEAQALWAEGDFRQASIGRGTEQQRRPEIRGDFVHWLEEGRLTPLQAAYWAQIDQLRRRLNQAFFLSMVEFEAHLATYPPGSFYKRHLDQHRQTRRRQIAAILYLNVDWATADGGQLRIYPQAEQWDRTVDVVPHAGTLVTFRCDTVYHEVLPATRQRYTLTGWLCTRE